MSATASESNVSYTVKELIARLEGKLDLALTIIHDKANNGEVMALAARVVSLESDRQATKTLSTYKRWLIGTAIIAVGAVSALASLLLN